MNLGPDEPNAFGINLFGYLTASLGLEVAARHTATMLLAYALPVRPVEVHPGGGILGCDAPGGVVDPLRAAWVADLACPIPNTLSRHTVRGSRTTAPVASPEWRYTSSRRARAGSRRA